MTHLEDKWATQALGAFAPSGAQGLSPLPNEVDYLATFRRMSRLSTPLAALGLRLALWLVALAPLWLCGRCMTISRLAEPERALLLSRLLTHSSFAVRELTLLLKFAAAMALLGTASVRARSGYDNVQATTKLESGLRLRVRATRSSASSGAALRAHGSWPAPKGPERKAS